MRSVFILVVSVLAWAPPALAKDKQARVFDAYMTTEIPPADGFDFPVGDRDGKGAYVAARTGKRYHGWYVATRFGVKNSLGIHPGEDWNGRGGGNTDLGQSARRVWYPFMSMGLGFWARCQGDHWRGLHRRIATRPWPAMAPLVRKVEKLERGVPRTYD